MKVSWPQREVPTGCPPQLWALLWAGLALQVVWLVFLVAASVVILWVHYA